MFYVANAVDKMEIQFKYTTNPTTFSLTTTINIQIRKLWERLFLVKWSIVKAIIVLMFVLNATTAVTDNSNIRCFIHCLSYKI